MEPFPGFSCITIHNVVEINTDIVDITIEVINMTKSPKLSKLELRIMEALWNNGASSIREIQEAFPEKERPAYTTVQTTVYRMEAKTAVRRVKKISNAHIFEATVSRDAAHGKLIDNLLNIFGGKAQPVVSHLIETGKLTLEDLQEARKTLKKLSKKDETK